MSYAYKQGVRSGACQRLYCGESRSDMVPTGQLPRTCGPLVLFLEATLLLLVVKHGVLAAHPNIIFIITDDLGWNDVGFHGSNQIPTPNIDALAYSGVILNNYYTMPVCTPSRAALMTGRHPIHTGMQHRVIFATEPWGLSLNETLLPEVLRDLGYATALVGKWHLGHFRREYTPTHRGFDSHFGFWSGRHDYYDHTAEERPLYWGYDMRRGENVTDQRGRYTTHLLTEEALRVVAEHDTSCPLFLYVSHLAVHSANPWLPLQAPAETVERFAYIKNPQRRVFAAMLNELDSSIGTLIGALGDRGMLENSIIVFTTDNGGAAGGFNRNAASNWPLRGTKDAMWEGGIRGAAFIWSPRLINTPRVSTQLMHIQDWMPTLVLGALQENLPLEVVERLDGRNVWAALCDPAVHTYDELLLAIDDQRGLANIRIANWKYFRGTVYGGHYDRVLGPSGRESEYDLQSVMASEVASVLRNTTKPPPDADKMMELRQSATVHCDPVEDPRKLCYPFYGDECLFDLATDPCEQHNLIHTQLGVREVLLARLAMHNSTAVPARNKPLDPNSNPKYWGYTWTNWMDYPTPPLLRQAAKRPKTNTTSCDKIKTIFTSHTCVIDIR
ncbi:hypothetical protein B566_EDAN001584 [Ephemera danica]|nr:hypothetical protein B566_EDAN001584 [Ephemera danica]